MAKTFRNMRSLMTVMKGLTLPKTIPAPKRSYSSGKKLDCSVLADLIVQHTRNELAAIGASPKVIVFLPTNANGKASLASATYVARKVKFFTQAGIQAFVERVGSAEGFSAVKLQLESAANSPKITGMMLQLPLPKGFYNDIKWDTRNLLDIIPAEKDIDVLSLTAMAQMHQLDSMKPPTPQGICALIDYYGIPTCGQHVTMIGKGALTGTPLTKILMDHPYNATISMCDQFSKAEHLRLFTNSADVVISAAGVPGLIKPEDVNSNTVLIDVAINTVSVDGQKKLIGDVDPAAHEKCAFYTSVPGGVGLLTTACLSFNVLNCYRMQKKLPLLTLRSLLAGEASHVYRQYICKSSIADASSKRPKILLLSSKYNGMSQSIERMLQLEGHQVFFRQATSTDVMLSVVEETAPDLIICSTIMEAIPKEIYSEIKCLIVHPGVRGDAEPSTIDWAINKHLDECRVTILEASEGMDAGYIWATQTFPISINDTKTSICNGNAIPVATKLVAECVTQFLDKDFCPAPLHPDVKGQLHVTTPQSQTTRTIDWAADTADDIITKVRAADNQPGVKASLKIGDEIVTYCIYGASKLQAVEADNIEPGSVFCKSGDAIGIVCVNGGGLWISQLQKVQNPLPEENMHPYKLPATTMLRGFLDEVPENADGFKQIHWEDRGTYGILHFDFYNGAMGTHHCDMLAEAITNISTNERSRLIILAGSPQNWCNGINLNMIEHAADPVTEAWNNVLAINKVAKAVIECTHDVVVCSVQANAGAGGVYLASAGDFTFFKPGLVLNPHLKNMGLFGSQLHTYSAVKRIGITNLIRLKSAGHPMLTRELEALKLADNLMEKLSDVDVVGVDMERENFMENVCTFAERFTISDYFGLNAFLKRKHAKLAELHLLKIIERCEQNELAEMRKDIFENRNGFAEKRRAFVFKQNM